jgi:hypothetical protein
MNISGVMGEITAAVKAPALPMFDAIKVEMEKSLNETKTDILPALINGQVADTKNSGVVWIGNCTATLIGPQTLLTAAHCTRSRVSFAVGGSRYSGACLSASDYPSNSTADYTLCHISVPVTSAAVKFETPNLDEDYVEKNQKILQSGLGCTQWGKQLDGKFRIGGATVLQTPSGRNYDYVTGKGEEGESVLCSGDSGGPAWGSASWEDRGKVISVNSRSNTKTRSYLSALATPSFEALLKRFTEKYNPKICGINHTENCYGLAPQEVSFEVQTDALVAGVTLKPEFSQKAESVRQRIKAMKP